MSNRKAAQVCFSPDDVLVYRPNWSEEQAEQWLEDNGKYIRDAMCEAGFEAIEALLPNEEETEEKEKDNGY